MIYFNLWSIASQTKITYFSHSLQISKINLHFYTYLSQNQVLKVKISKSWLLGQFVLLYLSDVLSSSHSWLFQLLYVL